ncbi:MAG: pantoate--beta-alanine ligase [Pseudomonadota bacterium]|nr:pantoate--beta-alanine ligase [Pseudomonadota bacterium]
MLMISDIPALRMRITDWRQARDRIALVPTMGNLHAGHACLIQHARASAARVVVSIFVNPMQFDRPEDLAAYPRTPQEDSRLLRELDVDLAFTPAVETVYPRTMHDTTRIEVPHLSSVLEGASRPRHFGGVSTVIAKLFNMVQPDLAVFGEKDYQQLVIIRRLVADLNLPLEIAGVPTVREADGLALSSRNRRLTTEERARAPKLFGELLRVRKRIQNGERDYPRLEAQAVHKLQAAGFKPNYVSVRCAKDLAVPSVCDAELVVLAAVWLGRTRLIDNIRMTLMEDR